ncbi:MAG: nucleotidyl transferase AbiEii/AbiGii toxin family protein [candidate division WWE3 bacterium]|nr:nucleotidyl transferase AbiEii/AbiGii toxin family protein [candidate division WWE3 bacterium]
MLTALEVKQLAAAKKIDEYSLLREYLQVVFLKNFYEQPNCETTFFKGGTAIKLVFGSFRFSEDLDFTTGGSQEVIQKLATEALRKLCVDENITGKLALIETIKPNFSFRLTFSNLPLSASQLFLKLDFSTRENALEPQTSVLTTTLPVSPLPIIKHLSAREIVAEKIRAIMHRSRGRDLFDLWYLLGRGEAIDWKFVERKLVYYHETISKEELQKRLANFSEKSLLLDLDKFLPENYRKVELDLVNKIIKLL